MLRTAGNCPTIVARHAGNRNAWVVPRICYDDGVSMGRIIRRTKHRILVVGEILRHPDTPWYVRVIAMAVVAYAASPIDIIPDFIPVFGYLDDIVLLPLGVLLILRLAPAHVRRDATRRAIRSTHTQKSPYRWVAAGAVASVWIAVVILVARRVLR